MIKKIEKILREVVREITKKGKGEPLVRRSIYQVKADQLLDLFNQELDKEWRKGHMEGKGVFDRRLKYKHNKGLLNE